MGTSLRNLFIFSQSGWGTQNIFKRSVNLGNPATGIDFSSAQYGKPIPVVYGQNKVAGNNIWYGEFATTTVSQSGKGGGQATGYSYSASFQLALCEGPINGVADVFNGTTVYTGGVPAIGGVLALGTAGQAAWAHLTGAAALGYSKTAIASFANYSLGSSASLPNLNFEIQGLKQYGSGIIDANPKDILNDICTDPDHGINFGLLGNLTQYSNYCVANSLFLSPVYDTQSTAQQVLADLFAYTNSEAFFSEGVLKVVPRGDTAVTGNSVTFTPVTTIQYSLDYTCFVTSNKGDAPVTVSRKAPADCKNMVRVGYSDRAYSYHPSVQVSSIDYDILLNGARADVDHNVPAITTAAVAKLVGQNLLQQLFYIRNVYTFKLPWRFCDLEPMDLVALTDKNLQLVNFPVRITEVEEDEAGLLTITAEEFPEGVGYAIAYPVEPQVGTNQDFNVDPGPVSSPFIFRGPGFLVNNNQPEIWCAVAGANALWGGAQVFLSIDGVSYHPAGQTNRKALYGFTESAVWVASTVMAVGEIIYDSVTGSTQQISAITSDAKTGASVPAFNHTLNATTTDNHVTWKCIAVSSNLSWPIGAADPDIVNLPRVYLNTGQLLGGTQADADNFTTLAIVDSEVVSYETATLKSDGGYELGYLRRGAYGGTNANHLNGAPFARLDQAILRIPVDPSLIGTTVYMKFLSINVFNKTPRSLASETAYTYVVGTNVELPDVPATPGSFAAAPAPDGAYLTWTTANPAAVGVTSLERSPTGTGSWTVLKQVGRGDVSWHDIWSQADLNAGKTYFYRARAFGVLPQSGVSAYTANASTAAYANSLSSVLGHQRNMIPDSDAKFRLIYWAPRTAHSDIRLSGQVALPDPAANGFEYVGTGAASGSDGFVSLPIPIQPGTYTLSCSMVNISSTSGAAPGFGVYKPDLSTLYGFSEPSADGRSSCTVTIPSGITSVVVYLFTNNCTVTNGISLIWQQPQLEIGSVMTAYRSTDDQAGYGTLSGSGPATVPQAAFSASTTNAQIGVSWTGLSFTNPDGSTTSITNGSFTTTGLAASTTYWFYPYYDLLSGSIKWASGGGGSNGFAYSAASATAATTQNLAYHVPLSNGGIQFSTTAGGGGNGTGGGTKCLHPSAALTLNGEMKTADAMKRGDMVNTPNGRQPVISMERTKKHLWVQVKLSNGQVVTRTPEHVFIAGDMQPIHAYELRLNTILQGHHGLVAVIGLEIVEDEQDCVSFAVQDQLFYAEEGGVLEHNTTQKP